MENEVIQGDCLEVLKTLPDNSVDAIITDPPYGLEFMGKDWDKFSQGELSDRWQQAGKPSMEKFEGKNDWHSTPKPRYLNDISAMQNFQQFTFNWARECFRVLKSGGYLLSFSGTRTYHRMACAIEDAGFEVRDMIEWIYGSGFPKSLNIGKAVDKLQGNEREVVGKGSCGYQVSISKKRVEEGYRPNLTNATSETTITKGTSEWEGWGTALKPAHEPICMARKPLAEKTVAENVLKWGTGGINIDESRIEAEQRICKNAIIDNKIQARCMGIMGMGKDESEKQRYEQVYTQGRFPANLIHDGSEEVLKEFEKAGNCEAFAPVKSGQKGFGGIIYGKYKTAGDDGKTFQNDGLGTPSRFFKTCEFTKEDYEYPPFFYCAKASKSERNEGCGELELKRWGCMEANNADKMQLSGASLKGEPKKIQPTKNNHPTVKPLKLMEYLIKLITPKGGIILDPFAGSGTTLVASKKLGYKFIGIEKTEEYIPIIKARLGAVI